MILALRFLHILSCCVLFGAALFPLYGVHGEMPAGTERRLRVILLAMVGVAAVTAFALLGEEMAETIRGIGALRFLIALAILPLLLRRMTRLRSRVLAVAAAALLASHALTGHTGADLGAAAPIHRILDGLHLLAAGAWIGALAILSALAIAARRGPNEPALRMFHYGLAQFSGIGTAIVIALALSGILNPNFLASFNTPYGQVLLIKLALFGAMLACAGTNRYFLVPRFTRALAAKGGADPIVAALTASVLIESGLALIVLLLVGELAILPPALH